MFAADTEIAMAANGAYRLKTKTRGKGRQETVEGTFDLPTDVYNGMILIAVNDPPQGTTGTIHSVAFVPKPRLIELALCRSRGVRLA